jgi:DNA-binding winged helix-turn-helix (wHTH) protein/tetratricopeptide (TPR) repeat protein
MSNSFRFGPFTLDRDSYRLLRDGEPLTLAPKAIDLLFLFCARPAALITKDDILSALWPGIAVTDNAITQVVSDLRHVLGDSAAAPSFVQTVPRRGYRFVAPVEPVDPVTRTPATTPHRPRPVGTGPARPRTRAVAVMDFTNVTGDPEMQWLAAGIAETVTNDLRSIRDLVVLDRALVAESSRRTIAGATDRPLGPDLLIVGSFQQSGDRLRITARAVDVLTREAIAHAKADGPLGDVFELQDAVVTRLSAALQLTITPAAAVRIHARETSSLEAYRALTEGRLKLESMDAAQIGPAADDFARALALDPRYALAHVGYAHARYWAFFLTRATNRPDMEALRDAVAHARRAVELDAELAEGHAALAFVLSTADRHSEAIAAGRLAVALEPDNWRHHFRLGMAAWGSERLAALQLVVQRFPQLAYAYFGIAMVHVARGDLGPAEIILRQGLTFEPDASGSERFPGHGLHWLLGLIRLASGDVDGACARFDRELATTGRGLFGNEFAMDACDGAGFARLAAGDAAGARVMFRRALERYPEHARSWLGLADAALRDGLISEAETAMTKAAGAIEELKANGRATEALLMLAYSEVVAGFGTAAVATLTRMLEQAPPGPAGWSLPVEPWLATLRGDGSCRDVLLTLARRAD